MAWPLLDELRALAAEDWWPDDDDDIREVESKISCQTGVELHIDVELVIEKRYDSLRRQTRPTERVLSSSWTTHGAAFLGSCDAAALLEDELVRRLRAKDVYMPSVRFSHTWWPMSKEDRGHPIVVAEIFGLPNEDHVSAWAKTEPVARTLAVMGAGHELGIWPIGPEDR